MDDSDDEFSDDFGDSTAPRRRTGMATIRPAISSIELEARAAMYSEKLLMPDIPFLEIEDEDDGAPQPPQIPTELDRVRAAIAKYHMDRIAIARSLGPGATEAAFKAACKANGV